MRELDTLRDWCAFNARARRGYLETFARLPRKELTRERGASYPTLLKIMEHTLDANRIWIQKGSVGEEAAPYIDLGPDPSLDEIRLYEDQVRAEMVRFLNGLTEEDLDRTFRIPKGGGFPSDLVLSVRDMLWHLVEEELQHRGELNALLWQFDVDPPIFDWIDWINIPERGQPVAGSQPVRE